MKRKQGNFYCIYFEIAFPILTDFPLRISPDGLDEAVNFMPLVALRQKRVKILMQLCDAR
jgi:hypothetical protein